MKKLTTEEFIEKAVKVHGDRFSYEFSEYISSRDKIKITCKIHGVFEQTASSHLKGNGCYKCRDTKRSPVKEKNNSTTKQLNRRDEFIRKAKLKHGEDKYDYSLVEYVNSSTNVTILCKDHGPFSQRPSHHTNKTGCPKCFAMRYGQHLKLTQEEFIRRSIETHGNKYDYSLVDYKNSNADVKIICPKHGLFEQKPKHHMVRTGCRICGHESCSALNKSTTEEFIRKAKEVHGDTYSYDETVYETATKKVKIKCNIHGIFLQVPHNHLSGNCCHKCNPAKKMTKDEFIAKAEAAHGKGTYSYDNVEYKNNLTSVSIVCQEHGVFKQTPTTHLKGCGCPSCSTRGFRSTFPAHVYLFANDDVFKVGITNREVLTRLKQINKSSSLNLESVYYKKMYGETAQQVEQKLLIWLRGNHRQPAEKFDGYKETFYVNQTTIPQIIDKLIEFEKEIADGQ